MTKREFERTLYRCGLLLVTKGEQVQFVHKRMYDWLKGAETAAMIDGSEADLGVDDERGHELLADFCVGHAEHPFALEHGVFHLQQAPVASPLELHTASIPTLILCPPSG